MRTRTTLLAATAAALLGVGAFTTGLVAADSDDDPHPRDEMHAQMGGDMGMDMGMDDMEVMQQMHEAIDPAAMDDMHGQMRELLPADLRDEADEMHERMPGAETDAISVHQSHHANGS